MESIFHKYLSAIIWRKMKNSMYTLQPETHVGLVCKDPFVGTMLYLVILLLFLNCPKGEVGSNFINNREEQCQ